MLSPISLVAAASALKADTPAGPTALTISAAQASAGLAQLASFTNAAVGVLCELSATCVRPSRMRSTVSLPAVTMGSQPMIRSAPAMLTRVVRMSSGWSLIST
jgi:hypothetical protein